MKPIKRYFDSVTLFEIPQFGDDRGSFAVPYESTSALAAGLPERFVQDNHSLSVPVGTLRGLHLQLPPKGQGKLIRVLRGRVLDVFVDLRPADSIAGGHKRGAFDSVHLSGEDNQVLWIPPGFAHGFCTLEADTEVFYKVDAPYAPDAELTLAWNDPSVGIEWPFDETQVTLSAKDQVGLDLATVVDRFDQALAGE